MTLPKCPDIKKYPFPYTSEKFTVKEKQILNNFFTNLDKPVFAIYNLPQEVVGAMFSRYSRSAKSVRRLFLDEFWNPAFSAYKSDQAKIAKAKARTADFYKKVFAEFGDDSVIQMGSVHIAFEYVSQIIAAKAIEDQRIGASYIEKSTRYVNFSDKTESGHYLFMEEPDIMKSSFAKEYLAWNNLAFDTYVSSLAPTIEYLRTKYPLKIEKGESEEDLSKAYERALRAKALDVIRIFLPLTTVTNLGAHFSGQAAENAINKMLISEHPEVRGLGLMAYEELVKITPNFLQNIDHHHGEVTRKYRQDLITLKNIVSEKYERKINNVNLPETKLVDFDHDALLKIASQLIYTGQSVDSYLSKNAIRKWLKKNVSTKIQEKIIKDSLPDRSLPDYNRRHKLPRAFEQAFVEMDFYKDLGTYKDLQRNRLSSTERLLINADEAWIPDDLEAKGMEEVLKKYLNLLKVTKELNQKLRNCKDQKLVSASEYVAVAGNKLRFNIKANLRQWVFFAELRTAPGGHKSYRHAMQEAAKEIIKVLPFTKSLFAKVDWSYDCGLGRFKAEVATQKKLAEQVNKNG